MYTARPSHAPTGALGTIKGYSGEAELAMELAGVSEFPLVGMGMMDWLAARHNERSADLTKPNTTQAMAALLAAIARKSDADTLEQAYRLDRKLLDPRDSLLEPLRRNHFTVYVFEDTVSGIKPMLTVAERLYEMNYRFSARPMGIARDHGKRQALQKFCQVFDDVNLALRAIEHEAASGGAELLP
jgi:hypothetical protein